MPVLPAVKRMASSMSRADRFRQLLGAADDQQADIVAVDRREFLFQIFAKQAHQEIDFGLRAAPVFQREGVERQRWKL